MRCNVIETETEEGKGEGGGEGEWEDWTKIAAVPEGGGLGGGGAHWWYHQLLLDRSGGGSDGGGLREGEVILSRADPTGTLLDIAGSGSVPGSQPSFRALPSSLRRACRRGRDAGPAAESKVSGSQEAAQTPAAGLLDSGSGVVPLLMRRGVAACLRSFPGECRPVFF